VYLELSVCVLLLVAVREVIAVTIVCILIGVIEGAGCGGLMPAHMDMMTSFAFGTLILGLDI